MDSRPSRRAETAGGDESAVSEYWSNHDDESEAELIFGGGASTVTPPAPHGPEGPADGIQYGPSFVRFVVDRFAAVEQIMSRLLQRNMNAAHEGWRFVKSSNTDASGNMAGSTALIIFESEPGQKFALHRLYVHAQGYSWKSPYTGSAELLVCVNDVPWAGLSLTSGQGALPAVFTAGRLQGVEVQDGERLTLEIKTGPVSTRIEARCLGVLTTVAGDDH